MKIKVVDAYNTPQGSSSRKLHKKGNCVGYVITIEGKTILEFEIQNIAF
jgi:L-ascorbate metabolism protein UlaG (beta-lactamase superfamily)